MRLLFLLLIGSTLSTCTFVQDRYPRLPPGPYRGVLELKANPIVPNPKGAPIPEKTGLEFDEVTDGVLPFTFDVVYEDDTTFRLEIHNGAETITVPAAHVHYGRNQKEGRDTVRLDFPVYDTHIWANYEEQVLEGTWNIHYREGRAIPFKAYFGQDHRFTKLRKAPAADISGQWAINFADSYEGIGAGQAYPGIADFTQDGNHLTGTFRTETGDFRYLEGTVQANKFYLSVFDGAHAFLFEGIILPDGGLNGIFRSGNTYVTSWSGRRDPDFRLSDPDSLTSLKEDVELDFEFPDSDGTLVGLNDERFAGKPKLIKIMGTWCPNCRDQAEFLKTYLAENDTEDLQVIALAFERYGADDARSKAAIRRYEANLQPPWPVLLAGSSRKSEATQALPMLDRVISYPTLLFVDRDNRVRRIHTGFNGPATSEYAAFAASFDATVRELLAPAPSQ